LQTINQEQKQRIGRRSETVVEESGEKGEKKRGKRLLFMSVVGPAEKPI